MRSGTGSAAPAPPEAAGTAGDGAAAALWAFSLDLYARPGVEPACLRLQDELGLDVNLLLLALHAGRCGHALADFDWARLDGRVAPLREHVIRPLREARRWLKAGSRASGDTADAAPGALRSAIAAVELQAERAAQTLLAVGLRAHDPPGARPPPPGGEGAAPIAAANLAGVVRLQVSEPLQARQRDDLATLLRAVFTQVPADDLVRALDLAFGPDRAPPG